MRELVESVFIIKNSLAQSWNAFVLKYAANCSSISSHKSAQEQQAEQVAWGRKKRCNKNVCIMIIATINWVQHKAYLQHVAAKQMTRKLHSIFVVYFSYRVCFLFLCWFKNIVLFVQSICKSSIPCTLCCKRQKMEVSAWLSFFHVAQFAGNFRCTALRSWR